MTQKLKRKYTCVLRSIRCIWCLCVSVCRTIGVGVLQRALSELGPGLRPMCPASVRHVRAMLHPAPTGHAEPAGLRVALHLLVSRSVACKHTNTKLYSHIYTLGWTETTFCLCADSLLSAGPIKDGVRCYSCHTEKGVRWKSHQR